MWLHLVRANPMFAALAENPRVLLSVAGDWAFIPSSWKVIDDEDPALGIPTTYYGAVQLAGTATVHDERTAPGSVAAILRRQLANLQPDVEVADPGRGPRRPAAGDPRASPSRWSRCRPSSSTAATSTGRTGGPWSSAWRSGARRVTMPRRRTWCGAWRADDGPKGAADGERRDVGLRDRDRCGQVGQRRLHLAFGVLGTVVTHDAGQHGEPLLALIDPGLGHAAARLGLLELVAPRRHLPADPTSRRTRRARRARTR